MFGKLVKMRYGLIITIYHLPLIRIFVSNYISFFIYTFHHLYSYFLCFRLICSFIHIRFLTIFSKRILKISEVALIFGCIFKIWPRGEENKKCPRFMTPRTRIQNVYTKYVYVWYVCIYVHSRHVYGRFLERIPFRVHSFYSISF